MLGDLNVVADMREVEGDTEDAKGDGAGGGGAVVSYT